MKNQFTKKEYSCPDCNEKFETEGEVYRHTCKLKTGTKYDNGKPQIGDFIKDFGIPLLEVSKVWAFGAAKYERANWKKVDNAEKRYTDALIRHLVAEEENPCDEESGFLHAAHVAWNALARLYFIAGKGK